MCRNYSGANDGIGITGVAYDAYIMPIRVLDADGFGSSSDIADGIIWAVDNGADVLNLSLGGGFDAGEYAALQYANDNGVVIVMASENEYAYQPGYPAAHADEFGLAVGSFNQSGNSSDFSNWAGNTVLDYVEAPGEDIYSTQMGSGYLSFWNINGYSSCSWNSRTIT